MPKSEPAKVKKRIAKWKEGQYPTIYANMMGIGMTPFDINVMFGEVTDSDDNSVTGTPKVKILLAPEQAANLMKLLSVAVDSFATTNGALRSAGSVDVVDFSEQLEAAKPKAN